jgi:3D (Asp-Asp-Asp) domain-containing protein
MLFLVVAFQPEAEKALPRVELEQNTLPMIGQNSLLPVEAIQTTEIEGIITQYTPRPEETDSMPFITASGKRVEEGMIANNCLEFGTIVEIENEFYVVEDRMNKRFSCNHFDILVFDLGKAIEFGKRNMTVTVYN